MASYRGHLTFSTSLGVAYSGVALWQLGYDWGTALLGGGLTAVGGLLPDLDSDSGVPVRELFNLAAALAPLLALKRLASYDLTPEQSLVIMAGVYCLIRYGVSRLFKRVTVHRGMFHSIPAMGIAGMLVFLLYPHAFMPIRLFLAGGVMLGFLSHLVLDELCSVDFSGVTIRLNKFAGSALKFASPSWPATTLTYTLFLTLTYFATRQFEGPHDRMCQLEERTLHIVSPVLSDMMYHRDANDAAPPPRPREHRERWRFREFEPVPATPPEAPVPSPEH
ncbi:MAG: metal-dependent hydrolase [Gemmataceae bacterium]